MTTTAKSQLELLAQPFEAKSVKTKPGRQGGAYVPHSVITQKALEIVGPYSIENVQLIRGLAPEIKSQNNTFAAVPNAVTGALVTIRATIDDREVVITEVGDCEQPAVRATDGERAKMAVSDAIKRCWMRLGLGLHLWSGDDYTLAGNLAEPEGPKPPAADAWKAWETRGQAIAWALEIFDPEGTALFAAPPHAANSFDKLFRAYVDSLAPSERPTKDSPANVRQHHLAQVFKLWNQKVLAKYGGGDLASPSPWQPPGGDELPFDAPADDPAPATAPAEGAREAMTV